MATRAEVQKWMDIIVERLNEIGPFCCEGWGGSLQFIFRDLKTGWLLKLKMDGTVESLEEKIDEEHATSIVDFTSDIFVKIYTKETSPTDPYFAGTMQIRGQMDGLIKVLAPTVE